VPQLLGNYRTDPSIKLLEIDTPTATRNGTTYQINTANIGRKAVQFRSHHGVTNQTIGLRIHAKRMSE
jgi:hypothetical protein